MPPLDAYPHPCRCAQGLRVGACSRLSVRSLHGNLAFLCDRRIGGPTVRFDQRLRWKQIRTTLTKGSFVPKALKFAVDTLIGVCGGIVILWAFLHFSW
jgi:hypothetical protein